MAEEIRNWIPFTFAQGNCDSRFLFLRTYLTSKIQNCVLHAWMYAWICSRPLQVRHPIVGLFNFSAVSWFPKSASTLSREICLHGSCTLAEVVMWWSKFRFQYFAIKVVQVTLASPPNYYNSSSTFDHTHCREKLVLPWRSRPKLRVCARGSPRCLPLSNLA